MARPKKEKVAETEAVETTKVIQRKLEVKDEPAIDEFVRVPKSRLQGATTYKVKLGGREQWLTRPQINISLQRGFNVEIPEGSPFTSDVERCSTCG